MGAMAAVYILGAIVNGIITAGIISRGPVVDGDDAIGRNIHVRGFGRATAQAGISHSYDLGGAVVAVGVGLIRAHDDASPILIMPFSNGERLNPGHVGDACNGIDLGIGSPNPQHLTISTYDPGAQILNGRGHLGCGNAPFHLHVEQILSLPLQGGADFITGLEDIHPVDFGHGRHGCGDTGWHAHFEREIGDIFQELNAHSLEAMLPGCLNRAAELDNVVS